MNSCTFATFCAILFATVFIHFRFGVLVLPFQIPAQNFKFFHSRYLSFQLLRPLYFSIEHVYELPCICYWITFCIFISPTWNKVIIIIIIIIIIHSMVFLKDFVIAYLVPLIFRRFIHILQYLNLSSAFSFTHISSSFLFSCWSAHFFVFCWISFFFLVDFLLIFLLWISFDVQARICLNFLICFSSFCILLFGPSWFLFCFLFSISAFATPSFASSDAPSLQYFPL